MSDAVVLTNRGGRIIGEYDGYGRVGGDEDASEHGACLHFACWEKAGKPDFDHYGKPSAHAPDQGWFFDDGDHDMIDPRITEGREELLAKGVEARTKARYDQRARQVREWLQDRKHDTKQPWEHRFHYGECYEHIKQEPGRYVPPKVLENEWYRTDSFGIHSFEEHFKGTEDEVRAHLSGLWDEFVASPECEQLLARALELREESRRAFHEHLKAKGRYEVSYGLSRVFQGKGYVQRFYVKDGMTFETLTVYEYEGEGDDPKARHAKAEAEALRLNLAWAAEGWPYVEPVV